MLLDNQSQYPVIPSCPHTGLLNWSGWRNEKGMEGHNELHPRTLKLALEKLAFHLPHCKLDWITLKVPVLTFYDSNFPL